MNHPRDLSLHLPGGGGGRGELRPPELPRDPLEFLSRSWSASAVDVSRALSADAPAAAAAAVGPIAEDAAGELDDGGGGAAVAGSSFSFASAATSQLIMERIMSQSQQEVSPLTSGRLSHSSGPLNGGGSLSDSPPVSPEIDDAK